MYLEEEGYVVNNRWLWWSTVAVFGIVFLIANPIVPGSRLDAGLASGNEGRSNPGLARQIQEAFDQEMDTSQATPTWTATPEPTPTPRPKAQVGSNAGLVLGASVLVLIVIGGVVWSSRRKK